MSGRAQGSSREGSTSNGHAGDRHNGQNPSVQRDDPNLTPVQAAKITQPMRGLRSMRSLTSEAIENQLMLMWRQVAHADLASGNPVVAHNSVMTLIAYTGDKERSQRIEEVVTAIIAQVAARAIVLVPAPALPPEPPIEVSLSIQERDASGNPAHGEEILIKAHDDAVPHLPGAVLPLVLSGLPAFLWWSGEPPWHTELFDALLDGCDRLIVDTSEVANAERALFRLNELVSRKKTSVGITDLNWWRQTPWRELVAQFFDDPQIRKYLYGIDRVRIEYAAGSESQPTNPAQGYLFAGWLASRLNWVPHGLASPVGGGLSRVERTREYALLSAQGRHIALELVPRYDVPIKPWIDIAAPTIPEAGADGADGSSGASETGTAASSPAARRPLLAVGPGALMSIHLHALVDGKTGTFVVAREADLETASTLCHADCAMPSQSCHLPTLGEAQSLLEQLQILGHDTLYEQALNVASHLAGPNGRRSTT